MTKVQCIPITKSQRYQLNHGNYPGWELKLQQAYKFITEVRRSIAIIDTRQSDQDTADDIALYEILSMAADLIRKELPRKSRGTY